MLFQHPPAPQKCTKNGALKNRTPSATLHSQAPPGHLARLANFNVVVTDKELRRALIGATDHRQQSRYLPPRDEPQRSAFRAREHRPIRVVVVANVARVLEHEHRTRLHLLRDPLRQYIQFLDHDTSW